jgi:hypothetical protein
MARAGKEFASLLTSVDDLIEVQGIQLGYLPLTRMARCVLHPEDCEITDPRIRELLGEGDFLQLVVAGSKKREVVRIHLFAKPLKKGNQGLILNYKENCLTMQTYPINPPYEFALSHSVSPFEVKPESIKTFAGLLALAVRLA